MQSNVKVAKVFARADLSFLLTVLEWCWILMSMAVLEWPGRSNEVKTQLVAEGLQDVKVRHVAVDKNHRVALSLDGQLFSWGWCGTVLPSRELGHQLGTSNAQNYYRVKTSWPEDDAGKQQLASSRSNQALARPRTTASATATGVPHRVVTAPELFFFTHMSCGKHRLNTVVSPW